MIVPTPPDQSLPAAKRSLRLRALWHAAFAGTAIITAGSQLSGLVGARNAGLIGMLAGAMQLAVTTYYMTVDGKSS